MGSCRARVTLGDTPRPRGMHTTTQPATTESPGISDAEKNETHPDLSTRKRSSAMATSSSSRCFRAAPIFFDLVARARESTPAFAPPFSARRIAFLSSFLDTAGLREDAKQRGRPRRVNALLERSAYIASSVLKLSVQL